MAGRRSRRPIIDRILRGAGRGAGRPVKRLSPGMLLRLEGRDFGEKADKCTVFFGEVEVQPHEMGFDDESFLVSVPLPPESTKTLRVRVGRTMSEPVECRLARPRPSRREPGSEILAYYAELDELATATAALASVLAPATPFRVELERAASMMDGCRGSLLRSAEAVRLCAAAQETVEPPDGLGLLKSVRAMDEALRSAGAVQELGVLRRSLFGPRGRVQQVASKADVDASAVLSRRAADPGQIEAMQGIFESDGFTTGFFLHEASKAIEGVEDLFDLFQPSFDVTPIDVTMDFGGPVSAIAKVIDVIGQLFSRIEADISAEDLIGRLTRIDLKLDRQEIKLDRLGTDLGDIRSTLTTVKETIGRIETALSALGTAVNEVVKATERLEGKADAAEGKLDVLEVKGDQASTERSMIREQLGLLEGKADAMAVQLGMQEEKLDRAEGMLDALEAKADRSEGKLDSLEAKGDRAEGKLDSVEAKADRAEGKLDSLEAKADRAEGKLDAIEAKEDRAEGKLDGLEAKADRVEEKLDRQEVKLDRLRLPVPLEGTVAPQRGGGDRVTSAVAVTGATDNRVYLRAAIAVDPARLDEEGAWSAWVDLGRPTNAGGLLEASMDLAYEDGSDEVLTGLLSARDETGRVYRRAFEAGDAADLVDPAAWTGWERFLSQPGVPGSP